MEAAIMAKTLNLLPLFALGLLALLAGGLGRTDAYGKISATRSIGAARRSLSSVSQSPQERNP